MATYFTADCHFGHFNIIKHCNRPFETLDEMNKTLITNWNARVNKNDHVYIAGDLAWSSGFENALSIIKQLNGVLHLAVGNHDKDFLKKNEYRELFAKIESVLTVKDAKRKIIICHYPIAEWDGSRRDSWHVYGHIHNTRDETHAFMATRERSLNAGVDICKFMPVTFDELIGHNNAFNSV